MGLTDDLTAETVKILKEKWSMRAGVQVPDTVDLKLANDGVTLDGAVLYADLADSTGMVMSKLPTFVAEVYKCYLNMASRIIRARGGAITAFDGDRVMAVFLGPTRCSDAARAALAINHAVSKILNPKVRESYPALEPGFSIKQAVGIDTSTLFVARTGIRGSNDLVWVGRAANLAAKLCALRDGDFASWITGEVFDQLTDEVKLGPQRQPMWEERSWAAQQKLRIYRSSWFWPL